MQEVHTGVTIKARQGHTETLLRMSNVRGEEMRGGGGGEGEADAGDRVRMGRCVGLEGRSGRV